MRGVRLEGPAAAAAALAATAALVFDAGGYGALSWDRTLLGLAALDLLLVLLVGVTRPGRLATALLGALALLTVWTAGSWLWSDSPPAALEEAQRTALYLAAVAAVVLAGRRVGAAWVAGGVVAAATAAAVWNVAVRLAPDWTGRAAQLADSGALADPIGYANGLAALAVLGLLLALGLGLSGSRPVRAVAGACLVPLAAALALQQSTGAVTALAAGLGAFVLVQERPLAAAARVVGVGALPLAAGLVVASRHAVVSPPPGNLLAAAPSGHLLVGVLAIIVPLQAAAAVLAPARLPGGRRIAGRLRAAVAGVAGLVLLAAALLGVHGHDRLQYWRVALREIRAEPLLGSGAGTFVDWWLRHRTVPLSTQEAHSLYLETLAELGPVGLALLVVALAAPLLAAFRLRRDPVGPALLASLVAFDLHAALDFDWELAGVTLPALLVGASATVHAGRATGLVPARRLVPAAAAFAALATGGALALAGNASLATARDARAANDPAAAATAARRALRFAGWSADAWRALGEARLALGDRAGAAAAFRSAVARDPNDWSAWVDLASATTGEPRRAAQARAARLNPLG